MTRYWQEIATTIIIVAALWLLIRKYLVRAADKPQSKAADACAPCSLSSCDGCAVKDLLNDIEASKKGKTGISKNIR